MGTLFFRKDGVCMQNRELFCKRIAEELKEFKDSVLTKDKESIYGDSYKIEVYVNIYEILIEQAEKLSEAVLLVWLNQSSGIIASLYVRWLKKEDDFYEELKNHVLEEMVQCED